jgi:ABC-type proline/glycine betaine transport system substrate-binding protein
VEENPDVAALFRNQNLSNADQSKMIYEVEVNGRDLGEVVQEWMDANQDVWRAWIPNS